MSRSRGGVGPRLRLAAPGLVLGVATACGAGEDAPRWIRLARGFEPAPALETVRSWRWDTAPLRVREDAKRGGVWVDYDIPSTDWRFVPKWGVFRAQRPDLASFQHRIRYAVELTCDGEKLSPFVERFSKEGVDIPEGTFSCSRNSIWMRPPHGAELPGRTILSSYLDRGAAADGVWRSNLQGMTADGLPVWPGESATIPCDVPPASALRFRAAVHGLQDGARVALRVALDGDVLAERDVRCGEATELVSFDAALPPGGLDGARFTFEVRGDPAVSVFLDPVVGPLDVGTYGRRPWSDARPDLVVFVADTLRADGLAAWGGDPRVAPTLNALADDSARFLRARSTSVWTLPAHSSMFTGLFPLEHGAVTDERTFAPALLTIAEHLSAFGYRTAAITEGGYVSRVFGLDQGFALFDEESTRLDRTLSSALDFLALDDGRPVFLFVQTYRVHGPYRIGPDEDTRPGKELKARVSARMRQKTEESGVEAGFSDVLPEFVDEYHELYLGGVRALDAALRPWLASLDELGLSRGHLLFTSDHGEEFLEHGRHSHGGAPHEEKIRVPLLLRGPGIEPRDVLFGASHVDLAPTLADLAGVPPVDGWRGRSLLSLDRERPLFAYNSSGDQEHLTAFEGDRKIFANGGDALVRGELEAAYDIAADPGERASVLGPAVSWPEDLARRVGPLWSTLSRPRWETSEVELDDRTRQALRDLGYVE